MNFAVIRNDVVVNTVVADNEEIARSVTGLEVIDISMNPLKIGDWRDADGWHGSVDFAYQGDAGRVE